VVDRAFDARRALSWRDRADDAVILDIACEDGRDLVIEAWRRAGRAMPVLMLTARDRWSDKVQGFDAGADDYVAKRSTWKRFWRACARFCAARSARQERVYLRAGAARLAHRARQRRRQPGQAHQHEYRLLSYLMHHTGRVVSRTELVEHLYDQDFDRDSNTIEVFVGRIRKKLGVDVIQTVRGLAIADAAGGVIMRPSHAR